VANLITVVALLASTVCVAVVAAKSHLWWLLLSSAVVWSRPGVSIPVIRFEDCSWRVAHGVLLWPLSMRPYLPRLGVGLGAGLDAVGEDKVGAVFLLRSL
jgi:hypothetical protein